MRQTFRVLLAAVLVFGAIPLYAQRGGDVLAEVRLFPLEFLSNADAAKLVSPFIPSGPRNGVFEAGSAVRGITVRAPKDVLERVDSLLKANDRAPATVVLRFQLIAAVDSLGRDPAIPGAVDSTLKDLFRFGGYRLIAQASATVGSGSFQVTLGPAGVQYTIRGQLASFAFRRLRNASTGAASTELTSVQLDVVLTGPFELLSANGVKSTQFQTLLSTGLSVPLGQTVVLGSATGTGERRAVILTVRPETVVPPKERK